MKHCHAPIAFALEFLTLLESEITHQTVSPANCGEVVAEQRTDVETNYMTPKVGRLTVYLAVKHVVTVNNIEVQQAIVRYSAQFRQMGIIKAEDLVHFGAVKAPGMIFPFVREIVALLTASAPSGPVFLNEIDFVQLCRKQMPEN